MSIDRAPRESYNHATRSAIQFDEEGYIGTIRGQVAVDDRDVLGLTRSVVRADRPRTWIRDEDRSTEI